MLDPKLHQAITLSNLHTLVTNYSYKKKIVIQSSLTLLMVEQLYIIQKDTFRSLFNESSSTAYKDNVAEHHGGAILAKDHCRKICEAC